MTGLVVRELDGEVLIYDLANDRAHCLNRTAGLVWKHCNGQTSVAEIAMAVAGELKTSIAQDVIWQALYQLGNDALLEEQISRPAPAAGITRRDMLVKVGVGAAVALPVIASITAPTAVYAAGSCGKACSSTNPCGAGACPNCFNHSGSGPCGNTGNDCLCHA